MPPDTLVGLAVTLTLTQRCCRWPTWSQYFPAGNWLTTAPTTAVTSGNYPSSGTTLRDSTTFSYIMTISNTILCISGASVSSSRCGVHVLLLGAAAPSSIRGVCSSGGPPWQLARPALAQQ